MAVLYPRDRHEWWAPQAGKCFYCDGGFEPEESIVFWSEDGSIVLHPTCARDLGVHMISDAREAELASGEMPWSRRAAQALRASLQRAEGVTNA